MAMVAYIMEPPESFNCADDEIRFWKKTAETYRQGQLELKEELEEFQASSRELEIELETQLDQIESRNKDLNTANQRLEMEVENLRERLEALSSTSHEQISQLENELAQVTAYKGELQRYIRELEQSNDDLERAKRATVVSLEEFEARLNTAIERNAFLEEELEDKESLAITVQRLKDESRDLKSELAVKHLVDGDDDNKEMSRSRMPVEPVRTEVKLNRPEAIRVGNTEQRPSSISSASPITPSARISALNIVGDLLRKVGALESKLASCKSTTKDSNRTPQDSTFRTRKMLKNTPNNNRHTKKLAS